MQEEEQSTLLHVHRHALTCADVRVFCVGENRWDPRNLRSGLISSLLLNAAAPGGVLVAHDGCGARAPVLEALRVVLPELRRRGFGIVTLSELAAAAEEEAAEDAVAHS